MTDLELAAYLNLTPDEAEIVLPKIKPEQRATFERMARLEQEIADYILGIGERPKGVLLDFDRKRKRRNR